MRMWYIKPNFPSPRKGKAPLEYPHLLEMPPNIHDLLRVSGKLRWLANWLRYHFASCSALLNQQGLNRRVFISGVPPQTPNLPLFTTGSGGCAPSCQTCHNRHLNSGWISRSPSRSVSDGPLPTIGVKETAISLPGSANHENQPVFSRAWLDRTSEN